MNSNASQPDETQTKSPALLQETQRPRSGRLVKWSCALAITIACLLGGWKLYSDSLLRSLPSSIAAAELSLRAGKTAVAKDQIESVLLYAPQNPEARSILGRCLLDQKRPAEAIQEFGMIPADSSAFEKAGFALATAYLQIGDLELAETTLRKYLDRFPESDSAREELRWLYFNQFRTRDVILLLEQKLSLVPGDPKTLADLLDSEYRPQVPFEGAAYLEQIERQHPGQGPVCLALGFAHWRMGHVEPARGLFEKALAARPDDPASRFIFASFLIEQGQLKEAERILDRPPVPETDDRYWAVRSQISEQRNDSEAALSQLDQAIKRQGLDHQSATRRANLLRRLGRGAEAEIASRKAYELLKIDRQFADIVESHVQHHPARNDALKIASLYAQVGKELEAKQWQMLGERLREGKIMP